MSTNSLFAVSTGLLFAVACGSQAAPQRHANHANHADRGTEESPRAAQSYESNATMSPSATGKDIVDVAAEAGTFQTLLAAAEAADLVDALRGDGPLTVFAPTDEAFAKLPEGTVEALLKDKDKLTAILTYHVVSGRVMASDAMGLSSAKTLQGQEISISSDSGVRINDANVIAADVMADNGVIHVIDTVLIPM